MITIERVYQQAVERDSYRVLVDRLWPRGVSKEAANIDLWLKEIAPSSNLRKRFNHDPEKFEQFKNEYHAELDNNAIVAQLLELCRQYSHVKLLYSARDQQHNQAVVLRDYIRKKIGK